MARQIDASLELVLLQMQEDRTWGEVVVKYEGGRVVLMKRTETIKPSSDRDNRSED